MEKLNKILKTLKKNEIVIKRTSLRSIGISLISYGMVSLSTNLLIAIISIIAGLIVLGIKDYIEENL